MARKTRIVLATFTVVLSAGLGGLPAAAQQDSVQQQFNDIRGGLGFGQERAPIDFTERPPLVVPPSNDLPPPAPSSSAKLPVVDPDIVARRKALSDPRRPVPPTDPGASASGRSARAYLVDPPAGMRDPDIVAGESTTDRPAPTGPTRRRAARRKGRTAKAAKASE